MVAGDGAFVEACFRHHGGGKVAAESILAFLRGYVLDCVIEVFECVVHDLVSRGAGTEDFLAVFLNSRVESLCHQRHVAVAAHQLVILEAAYQACYGREVFLLGIGERAACHAFDNQVGATDIDIGVVPACGRCGHIDVLPRGELVAAASGGLVVVQAGEVEFTGA